MNQLLRLTDRSFNHEVCQCEIPVLVEFSASWCIPSRQMKPVLEKLTEEYNGKLKIADLNVDQNPRAASKYQIMGCPTFIILISGKVIQRRTGAQSKKQLMKMIQSVVNSQ